MDFHPGASSPNIFNWIPTKWLNKVKTSGPWLGVVSGQDSRGTKHVFWPLQAGDGRVDSIPNTGEPFLRILACIPLLPLLPLYYAMHTSSASWSSGALTHLDPHSLLFSLQSTIECPPPHLRSRNIPQNQSLNEILSENNKQGLEAWSTSIQTFYGDDLRLEEVNMMVIAVWWVSALAVALLLCPDWPRLLRRSTTAPSGRLLGSKLAGVPTGLSPGSLQKERTCTKTRSCSRCTRGMLRGCSQPAWNMII